jgi:hypothetical protein
MYAEDSFVSEHGSCHSCPACPSRTACGPPAECRTELIPKPSTEFNIVIENTYYINTRAIIFIMFEK